MSLKYDSVVPWGRSYQEYIDMFNLTPEDLNKFILGCGDGPASFNATMYKKGKKAISIDPIYQFSAGQIKHRIQETYQTVISQTRQNQAKFIWTKIKDVDELGKIRMLAMDDFLVDYEPGLKQKRYIYAEMPVLPFKEKEFDLALSSHFLFLYSDHLSLDFHIRSIQEMLRASHEIRIFPLVDLNAIPSPYVKTIMDLCSDGGFETKIENVDYEFQKGGNQMLRIINKK